jgi:hypothetical protein
MSTFDNDNFYEDGDFYGGEHELSRDGILLCQACGERPASVTLMLGDVLGIVEVCYRCGHRILATAQADEVDDD